MHNRNSTPDGLIREDTHDFVTTYTPSGDNSINTLNRLFRGNRAYFLDRIAEQGVLLFRGFEPHNHHQFHELVTGSLGLEVWNGFNLKKTPGVVTSWLRRYSEGLVGGGDYRRYLNRDTVRLGPVEDSIQGPHTEGGVRSERSRYIALCCLEPAPHLAETGMADLNQAYLDLPKVLRARFNSAWNRFSYRSARRLNPLDRLILSLSPFEVTQREDGLADMALPPCPAACKVPENGKVCIQPWAFARNTNRQVRDAARRVFTDRGEIGLDSTAEGMELTWGLCDGQGNAIEWTEEEQQQVFEAIFRRALLMAWQKGDIALVDNIRIGHWRMNGQQGNRKLVQIQATAFNAEPYHPAHHPVGPELARA